MILKYLVVAGVIAIIYFMFIKKTPSKSSSNKDNNTPHDQEVDDLVKCESCGVYVEVNEAIVSGAKYYCSNECVQKSR
jgi:uncharacterized protein